MSEKQVQKCHAVNTSLYRSGWAFNWSCRMENLLQPIRSTTQILVVRSHQYGISALVPRISFAGKPGVASQLYSQVRIRGARGLITSENNAVDLMFGCITGDYGDHETIKFFKAPSSLLDWSMPSWKYHKEESKCL